jgi:DNA mismatch repair protein MutS
MSSLNVISQVSSSLTAKNNSIMECNHMTNALDSIIASLGSFSHLIGLSNILTEDAFERATTGGFIRDGVSKRLDHLRTEKEKLLSEKEDLKTKLAKVLLTNEFSLGVDVKYGPVLEFPKVKLANKKDIQDRLQGLSDIVILGIQRSTNAMKYSCKDWTDLYHKIQKQDDDIFKKELLLLEEACEQIKEQTFQIITAAKSLAEVDVSAAFAALAKEQNYVRPKLTNDCVYQIQGGRHPVVEYFQKERSNIFVKNDAKICGSERLWLLTGANMGGKSTFLRQRYFLWSKINSATIVILAQVGSFVPADKATIGGN